MSTSRKTVLIKDLGSRDYKPTWELQLQLQQKLINAKRNPEIQDNCLVSKAAGYLLLMEHPHVYTLGKSGKACHLLINEEGLVNRGATFVKIDRGGDITYHGPGQLVGYPILDLEQFCTDIGLYLRMLEECIIRVLATFGISGHRESGFTGVWVDNAKICAMGIKCSRWVSMHGFALNVNTDLAYFKHIVPCGLAKRPVTSMQQLLGSPVELLKVKESLQKIFEDVFNAQILPMENIYSVANQ
ncbi:MAG: lipoyl(octanoyl) transferase LipB [Balneolales bacterium]|nr:lipoyl(octanoyl) transferase LipB [Balneolales bacterium]